VGEGAVTSEELSFDIWSYTRETAPNDVDRARYDTR
jgi:hypothetical protein